MAVATKTKSKTTVVKKEISPYEQLLIDAVKKVKEFKLSAEANITSIFFKNPELIYTNEKLKVEEFSNNIWKIYFVIAHDVVIKEKKQSLDEITVGLYLEKHNKLKIKYEEYGGYDTIEKAKEYVKEENLIGYISELHKWNAVLGLLKAKFPVYDKLSKFADMDVEQIYAYYETHLNHIFINAEGDVKSYNLCEEIHDLVDEMDKGLAVGMPLYNSPILNKEIGGNLEGNITMLGALSGAGKTTTTIELILPQVITYDEKLCIMINEEDVTKWRKELIIWVANNIFKKDFQKYRLRDGKFSPEDKELLHQCADWIEEKKQNKNITIIPFPKYNASLAIKTIKKYHSLGCSMFILDTMKASADINSTDQVWTEMTKDSVAIYDCIKPAGKNVHIWITYQLGKSSTKQRHFTNDNIGLAKNIVDVASTNLMIRKPFDDEFEGGKNELKCFRLEGKNKLTRIPFKLDKNKSYTIIFVTKNRFGSTDEFQIISENDYSRNVYKELGIVNIPMDW